MSDTGTWPRRRLRAIDWLLNEGPKQPFIDNLMAEVCQALCVDGLPIDRVSVNLRTLHPQFLGARMLWYPSMTKEATLDLFGHSLVDEPRFINSPIRALYEGAEGIRQRLDMAPMPGEYGIFADLRAEGMTDYVALPMTFTDGKRHAATFSTKRQGGFTTEDLMDIGEMLPLLAMAFEVRSNRRIMKNLLNTYVGQLAGERILAGEIVRGSGATIRAAIWNCDLRGFTEIAETWPRDDVIGWLNEYFDVMAEPVSSHEGEILKFMGDGMLAIFPLEEPDACWRALQAAVDARRGMRALNDRRRARGQFELGFGLALHVGDVMYGNVGTAARLDFTVIGAAVNVAARMQSLSKDLRRQVLLSGPFANLCSCNAEFLASIGRYPLRGVQEPLEVFGLADER